LVSGQEGDLSRQQLVMRNS